ncbi:MAG: 3-oxoacyl-[acyl-carrier-protein] reductase [Armatimonadetes bacterium]|nr:3-oxoacyl-[acyl-carrier-protein] reductase [Armatimonadota bacterium]
MNLQDRVALVTGAGRGIGRLIALRLAALGAKIAVNSLHSETSENVASEIRRSGGSAVPLSANVGVYSEAESLVEECVRHFSRVDILVNNAGITRDGLLLRMKEMDWDAVLTTNLKSAFSCTRAASKWMIRQRYGRIINIASVSGIIGNVGQANYAASKAGLLGFTKAVARELAGRTITVNAVAPGFIETDMTRDLSPQVKEDLMRRIPLGRLGQPSDVAHMVAFLASDLASYITGQTFSVDGGMAM